MTKEILLLLLLIIIITNIQNKLCTTQFSHYLTADLQPDPGQQLWNPELADLLNFTKSLKKTKLPEKFKLPDKRGFELMGMSKNFLPPSQLPFIN